MRCEWAGSDSQMIAYHDREWGVPVHDDEKLFEMLTLEGAQAGLTWATILKKRAGYRKVFHHFTIKKVATMTKDDVSRLLKNKAIIRNRLKIEATIENARHVREIQREFGSFDAYLWQFVGTPIVNSPRGLPDIPVSTPLSDRISKNLKKRGFRFVGSTIVYAFMQAVGMVNDHTVTCFRYEEVKKRKEMSRFTVPQASAQ